MSYRCAICFDSFCPGCEESLLTPEADWDPYAGHVPADVPLGRTEDLWPDAFIECATCDGPLRLHNDPAEDFCPACRPVSADGAVILSFSPSRDGQPSPNGDTYRRAA